MSDLLLETVETVEKHKAGEAVGVYSVCSSHPLVIEASILQVLGEDGYLLVEATSNQVDQFGGYTGMKPRNFPRLVLGLAERRGLSADRVVLGGEHLGPNRWRGLPAEEAIIPTSRTPGNACFRTWRFWDTTDLAQPVFAAPV